MLCDLQDPVGPFSLVMLQGKFQSCLRPDDRYYPPTSPLEHCRVRGWYRLFEFERLAKEFLLAEKPRPHGAPPPVPADIVRIHLLQFLSLSVDESRAMRS